MFGIRGSQPVRFHERCELGVSGIISHKRGGFEITDLEANTAKWEQAQAAPRGFARTAIEKAIRA